MEPDFQLLIPSCYGDVSLTAIPDGCRLEYEKLSPQEVVALRSLRDRAAKKGWAKADAFDEIPADDGPYRGSGRLVEVTLKASIDDARKVLAKGLKPGRAILSVVKFAGGAVEELIKPADAIERARKEKKPAKAAEVAAPTKGCPAPDFENADLRATRALKAFLMPDQLADFERTQSFVARGLDTGHAYMLTSRQARGRLAAYGGRSLYDLDEAMPVCVHDWTVAASEELLTLMAFLSVPGGEKYIRYLPPEGGVETQNEWDIPGAVQLPRACRMPEELLD
jgi:hypothetical protein